MLIGKHLIAGEWVASTETFENYPVAGAADRFAKGEPDHVDEAVKGAEAAFRSYAALPRANRASFLRTICKEIDGRGDQITKIAMKETGLPEARLLGERARTTGQLRLFADHIETGAYLDRRHDPALPDREVAPRPRFAVDTTSYRTCGGFRSFEFSPRIFSCWR